MSASSLVNVNGQGLIADIQMKLSSPISGHDPVTVGDLFHRAEKARYIAKNYIEAAENMERLAMMEMTGVNEMPR